MKVSVITAVRNGANAIRSTIDSVNAQTYANIEHVFVDGASTDETVALIRAGSQRDYRVLSEPDTGIYDAFAKGFNLASGDVIVYLNAGDTYAHERIIESAVQRLMQGGVDAVFGDVDIVDELDPSIVRRRYRSGNFRPSKVAYGFMPAHPSLFVLRRAYERFGNYDSSYRIAGDFELVVRMFARGNISYSYVDEVFVKMIRGGISTSGIRSNLIITQEMKRACKSNAIATNYFKLALRFPIKVLELF